MATLAFVTARADDALVVIDVTAPSSPALMSVLRGAGSPTYLNGPRSVHMKDTRYAYVASELEDALTIVDLMDMATEGSIQGAGSPNYLDTPTGIFVLGNYAYVVSVSDNSLSIFDISTPSNPTLEGSIQGAGSPNFLHRAFMVFVVGNYAYIAASGGVAEGLTIIDETTPATPTYKGGLYGAGSPNYLQNPLGVYVVGDYAYVVSNALTAADNALVIINISNPAAPTLEGTVRGAGSPNFLDAPAGIFVVGDYAYVASQFEDAFIIFDISDKTTPVAVGNLRGSGIPNYLGRAYGVFVLGDYAYVATVDDDALVIIDITTKTAPSLAGVIRGGGTPNWLNSAMGVYVQSGYSASAVTTEPVTSIVRTAATGNGNITSLGVPNPSQYGVCWNTGGTPTIADDKTQEGEATATGAFTSSITGLTEATVYYVRAYATNLYGTSYGDEVSFRTPGGAYLGNPNIDQLIYQHVDGLNY